MRTEGDKHQGANETELQLSPGTKINKLSANVGGWRSYSSQTLRRKETKEPLCHNNERKKKSLITLKTEFDTFQRDFMMCYPRNILFNLVSPNHKIRQLQFLENWNVVSLLGTTSSDLRKSSEKSTIRIFKSSRPEAKLFLDFIHIIIMYKCCLIPCHYAVKRNTPSLPKYTWKNVITF